MKVMQQNQASARPVESDATPIGNVGTSPDRAASAKRSPRRRAAIGNKPANLRSKLSNGAVVLGDNRSALARRLRDLVSDLSIQLGGDPTPAEGAIIRRAATLAILAERDEATLAKGQEIDLAGYRATSLALASLLGRIGLRRRLKDATPGAATDAHARAILDLLPDTPDTPEPAARPPQGELDAPQTEEEPTP